MNEDLALVRAWTGIALLLLLAALAGAPYQAQFQPPAPGPPHGPVFVAFGLLAEALLVGWPLAFLGLWLGRAFGWGAPVLAGRVAPAAAARRLLRALGVGLLVGLALWGLAVAAERAMPGSFRTGRHFATAPWKGAVSALGAGVREETVFRLFLMTGVARLFYRITPRPGPAAAAGNVLAALAFGAAHFGNVVALGQSFNAANVSFVLVGNGLLGLVCGELYRRRGIEAAMTAHFAAGALSHGLLPAVARALH